MYDKFRGRDLSNEEKTEVIITMKKITDDG